MKILGISAFYHDSAAALIVDGKIIAAAQEERFTRKKHTPDFPLEACKYCLDYAGIDMDELDAVVFYDKPFLKFERLLETYYAFAPSGLISFLKAIPVWLHDKLFLKNRILNELADVGPYNKKKLKLLFTEHHLSHAASAFYPSGFEESAILTIDGVGEWCTASMGMGRKNEITFLKEMNFPHSVGLLYSAFTYYLGFAVNSGEYKLMGLAPFGDPKSDRTAEFQKLVKKHLVDIKTDGSIWLNQAYFNYATGLKMVNDKKWEKLFGFKRRKEEEELLQHHCDLAFAIQNIIEEIVVKMAHELKRITGSENLCMAGGVALNCVANSKLKQLNIFKNIYVQPASGDAGGAIGAALAISHLYFAVQREDDDGADKMQGTFLGPEYSEKEIESMARRTKAVAHKHDDFTQLTHEIASKLTEGKVIGWFQGRMEFGPRALGNRSILADARNPEMQKTLNLKIKNREGFRPFAPAMLAEEALKYFNEETPSPYMLFVSPLNMNYRSDLPQNYPSLSLWERLYCNRSIIPAVTHLDFTARIQTVNKETNPSFWELIHSFKQLTGLGMLINTSFNVRGEPIVCKPYDAYRCFMSTEMDTLVIGNYVFNKLEQPFFEKSEKWKSTFTRD